MKRLLLVLLPLAAACTPGPRPDVTSRDAYERYLGTLELAVGRDPTNWHLVRRQMRDPSPLARSGAIAAAVKSGHAEAPAAIVRLLGDPDPEVRADALRALAALGAEDRLPDLLVLLATDPEPDVRRAAALSVLPFSRRPEARKALVAAMNDPAASVRYNAWRVFCASYRRDDFPRDAKECAAFLEAALQEKP